MQKNKIDIPVFFGTFGNLTKLDLSFINAKIVLYKGTQFRKCLNSLLAPNVFSFSYIQLTADFDNTPIHEGKLVRRYAIIPSDITKPFHKVNWFHFYQLMLSIYPSDFSLVEELHLVPLGAQYQYGGKTGYNFKSSGEKYYENFMHIAKQEYKFINAFLKNYFNSSLNLKYLKYILSVYSNSFHESNPVYQYLSLIICLEATVEGSEQLTYRLKRNTALLCANSIASSKLIFDNVNQLYRLRSAIVHGQINPNYKHFNEYHKYLQTLVARLIRN